MSIDTSRLQCSLIITLHVLCKNSDQLGCYCWRHGITKPCMNQRPSTKIQAVNSRTRLISTFIFTSHHPWLELKIGLLLFSQVYRPTYSETELLHTLIYEVLWFNFDIFNSCISAKCRSSMQECTNKRTYIQLQYNIHRPTYIQLQYNIHTHKNNLYKDTRTQNTLIMITKKYSHN